MEVEGTLQADRDRDVLGIVASRNARMLDSTLVGRIDPDK